ncbi:MAG: hypothetical protein EA420_10780 [Candidatus Competibacteraceae bacterium]|nr:MAG: hypothetical protein EA420_10780 [Candidatus Competibacteraceae bacterium]
MPRVARPRAERPAPPLWPPWWVACWLWGGSMAPGGAAEDPFWQELPVVLSPTHLVQPLADAPAAVTVIDRDLIRAMGAREIPELLRRVAGVVVGWESNLSPVVSYHGLNGGYMRRMQVLVDGRSVYDPVFGGVHWATLPLEVEDIERIEFVRGPNAATDGANAFLATIDITTRQAAEDRGGIVQARIGNNGIRDVYSRYGQTSATVDYRLSAAFREDDGVDDRFDGKRLRYFSGRLDARPAPTVQLTGLAGYKSGDFAYGFDAATPLGACVPFHNRPIDDGYVQVRLEHNPSTAEQTLLQWYYTQLDARSAYRRLPPCGGGLDERSYSVRRHEVELRHSRAPSDAVRLVVGASARLDRAEATDRVSGWPGSPWRNTPRNQHLRLFGNLEYRLTPDWLVNIGAMLEHHSLTDETHGSPRLAVNYRLTDRQTLRFGLSRAVRVPAFLEESWRNDVWNNPGGLRAETILTREIGYLGSFPDWGLTLDLRVYQDRTDELLNVDVDRLPLQTTNRGWATIGGFEAQTRWRLTPATDVRFAYAYTDIDSDDPAGARYSASAPRHVADVFVTHAFNEGLSGSLGFNYAGGMEWLAGGTWVPPTRHLDLRLVQTLRFGGWPGRIGLNVDNLLGAQRTYQETNTLGRRLFLTLELPF